ncbi:MAG: recombinase family protein [Provencibacterium sp.]|jgi:site-specific DNA recombinase|nr:recombinase family protein [Provencibacterium sp.]
MKTAAAYIRVSTEEQSEYSPDSQLSLIRSYAQKENMLLPESLIFLDEGISGRSAGKRPAFQRMIALAKEKPRPFDVILLWKFSRFARSREDSVVYKSMLRRQCGIEVISVSEPLGDDKTSILIEAIIEAMDEYYSLNLSEEVRRGMKEKAERGEAVSAPPFGYRMENRRWAPDPERAPFVQKIFEAFLEGESCGEIAGQLERLGVHTQRGGAFSARAIGYILRNPAYDGRPRSKHRLWEETASSIPPLLPAGVYIAAQQRLRENRPSSKRPHTEEAGYLLRGLVTCSSCGRRLTRTGQSLQCQAYAKGRCSTSHSIALEAITRRVLAALERDFGNPCLTIQRKERTPSKDWDGPVLQTLVGKLERIDTAYEEGILGLEEYRERREALQNQLDRLKAQPGACSGCQPLPPIQKRLLDCLTGPNAGLPDGNQVLSLLVDHICFDRRRNRLEIYYVCASSPPALRRA